MSRPMGQLERSLAALTIGIHQGVTRRRKDLADTVAGQYEQQVHVPLSGHAGTTWGSTDRHVQWEMPFLYAPLQSRVPFPTPHFTPGYEITAGQGELVLIHAHVIDWTVTEANWYVGATVRFAIGAPNATALSAYSAIAHLSFRGMAAMAEEDAFA